jgi:hypothetical protein
MLEVESYATKLSIISSRIHRIMRLKGEIIGMCVDRGSDTECEADEDLKNRFFSHLSMWENPIHIDSVIWAEEAMREKAPLMDSSCLSSTFDQYIRDVLSNEPVSSQVQSAMDFSNLLKMRTAMAARDHARMHHDLRTLHDSQFRLTTSLRRYMDHFVPLINYLQSFSFSEEIVTSPTNETLAVISSLRERTEPILRELMRIACMEPFWRSLPLPVIGHQFNLLKEEISRVESSGIPRNVIWNNLLSPLFTSLRIDPEIRTREMADVDSRIDGIHKFAATVRSYMTATQESILRIDALLNELISFGYSAPTASTEEPVERIPDEIMARISQVLRESDD